jgi:hypothetical protein
MKELAKSAAFFLGIFYDPEERRACSSETSVAF